MSARKQVALFLVGAALLFGWLWFVGQVLSAEVPALTGRVNDYSGVLTESQRAQVGKRIEQFEKLPGHPQFAVLLPKTLQGEDVAEFAGDVSRAWGLGQRGLDNGLLLVVAPTERKLRLEVGYGLEASIPDGRAALILSKVKLKLTKGHEDWAAAILVAVDEAEASIRKEH